MNSKFAARLKEYLDSECSGYDLKYDWEWDEDCGHCEVTISNKHDTYSKELNFKYDDKKDDLLIELCEDSYYETREYDYTVKYFWILISPTMFPNN